MSSRAEESNGMVEVESEGRALALEGIPVCTRVNVLEE
jgi:hypothetical protein